MEINETNVDGFYKKLFSLNVPTCSSFSCLTQIKKSYFTNPDRMLLSCTETILVIVSTHSLKLVT